MPFARDLHPEFGYVGSGPRTFRKIGLVAAFVAFGIVAGASGVAVFMADPFSRAARWRPGTRIPAPLFSHFARKRLRRSHQYGMMSFLRCNAGAS